MKKGLMLICLCVLALAVVSVQALAAGGPHYIHAYYSPEEADVGLDNTYVAAGETVAFTVTPRPFYEVLRVTLDGESLTAGEGGEYAFVMPDRDARLTVICRAAPICTVTVWTDGGNKAVVRGCPQGIPLWQAAVCALYGMDQFQPELADEALQAANPNLGFAAVLPEKEGYAVNAMTPFVSHTAFAGAEEWAADAQTMLSSDNLLTGDTDVYLMWFRQIGEIDISGEWALCGGNIQESLATVACPENAPYHLMGTDAVSTLYQGVTAQGGDNIRYDVTLEADFGYVFADGITVTAEGALSTYGYAADETGRIAQAGITFEAAHDFSEWFEIPDTALTMRECAACGASQTRTAEEGYTLTLDVAGLGDNVTVSGLPAGASVMSVLKEMTGSLPQAAGYQFECFALAPLSSFDTWRAMRDSSALITGQTWPSGDADESRQMKIEGDVTVYAIYLRTVTAEVTVNAPACGSAGMRRNESGLWEMGTALEVWVPDDVPYDLSAYQQEGINPWGDPAAVTWNTYDEVLSGGKRYTVDIGIRPHMGYRVIGVNLGGSGVGQGRFYTVPDLQGVDVGVCQAAVTPYHWQDDPTDVTLTQIVTPSCVREGRSIQAVNCAGCGKPVLDTIVRTEPMTSHQWSEWATALEPTQEEDGREESFCYVCAEVRSRAIPALGKTTYRVTVERTGPYGASEAWASCERAEAGETVYVYYTEDGGVRVSQVTWRMGENEPQTVTGGQFVMPEGDVTVEVEFEYAPPSQPVIEGGGDFVGSTAVSIECPSGGALIYYTLDGTEPVTGLGQDADAPYVIGESARLYTGPFILEKTAYVRAVAVYPFEAGAEDGPQWDVYRSPMVWAYCHRTDNVAPMAADFRLPGFVQVIWDEAFRGIGARSVYVGDGCREIGSRAFADCGSLAQIRLPESLTSIAGDAFEGCHGVVIYGKAGSAAESYATAHFMVFEEE